MTDTLLDNSVMPVASRALNDVIQDTTTLYLDSIDENSIPDPQKIEQDIINLVNNVIALENINIPSIPVRDTDGNIVVDKNGKPKRVPLRNPWRSIDRLQPQQLADIVLHFHNIIRIDTAEINVENDDDLLGIYCNSGPHEGTYDTNSSTLYNIIKQYDYQLEHRKFEEVIYLLQARAPRHTRTHDRDLVPVNNGIFDYKTKTLLPFSPDKIFLTKSHVNYNPKASLPVIHNDLDNTDWDVETWMSELSDDPDIVNLLWQMLGAIIRPFVRWNTSIWLYSTTGNNGKGTLCELMRNLCGDGTHTSISLKKFSKDFALEPLIQANAIITDENDVGVYLDSLSDLKAIVTNDIIQINRKFKAPISFRFWGFMVQCINDLPRIRDKSDSFYRRQILVPMDKCFTGAERNYIKDEYLSRTDVLEYVLQKVLNMDFYKFSVPGRCLDLLGVYKELNDPVREFLNEFVNQFTWDLVPIDFMYDLYKAWYMRSNPCGKAESKASFKNDLSVLLMEPSYNSLWTLSTSALRVGSRMSLPEPLIYHFDLTSWKNPSYTGNDINKISSPRLTTDRFRGLVRRTSAVQTIIASNNE